MSNKPNPKRKVVGAKFEVGAKIIERHPLTIIQFPRFNTKEGIKEGTIIVVKHPVYLAFEDNSFKYVSSNDKSYTMKNLGPKTMSLIKEWIMKESSHDNIEYDF